MPVAKNCTIKVVKNNVAAHVAWQKTLGILIGAWIFISAILGMSAASGASISWWACIHTFTLGALTSAVIGYSTHFTATLTRGPLPALRPLAAKILILQGCLMVMLLRPGWTMAHTVAACLAAAVILWHAATLTRMHQRALANRLATTSWAYVVACLLLALAIGLAIAAQFTDRHDALVAAHARSAVWGFGWTVLMGTVITLLPTVAGVPTVLRFRDARVFVAHGLAVAVTAACIAAGWSRTGGLILVGLALTSAWVLLPIIAELTRPVASLNAATVHITCGTLWVLACMGGDAVALIFGSTERLSTAGGLLALLGAGFAQSILGATSQLIPVLTGNAGARDRLAAGLCFRAVLLNLGGCVAVLLSPVVGAVCMTAAVVWHVSTLLISMTKVKRSI